MNKKKEINFFVAISYNKNVIMYQKYSRTFIDERFAKLMINVFLGLFKNIILSLMTYCFYKLGMDVKHKWLENMLGNNLEVKCPPYHPDQLI